MGKYKEITHEQYEATIINSIEDIYTAKRQKGKSPTFLLQFDGTFYGLMRKFGFSKKVAKQIESKFLEMYKKSKAWTAKRIKKAHKDGYVTGAFNLRLKTPILKQTMWRSSLAPGETGVEARSAGNMISGQSYGILTLRAFGEFMKKVRKHKKYATRIAPWSSIYDAIYLEIDDDAEQVYWVNKQLVKEMINIDGCPELEHPKVKMKTVLAIYYPTWADEHKIPNDASLKDIKKIMKEMRKK